MPFIPAIGIIAGIGISAGVSYATNRLFAPHTHQEIEGPRLTDRFVQASTYGEPIPLVYGKARLAGNLIWSSEIREEKKARDTTTGGKKGSNTVTETYYEYTASWAVAICTGPIQKFIRIWADGRLIWQEPSSTETPVDIVPPEELPTRYRDGYYPYYRDDEAAWPDARYKPYIQSNVPKQNTGQYDEVVKGKIDFYLGTETQAVSGEIQKYEGIDNTPAFRGLAYLVFRDVKLEKFGNRIPNITAEVATAEGLPVYRFIQSEPVWASDSNPDYAWGFHSAALSGNYLYQLFDADYMAYPNGDGPDPANPYGENTDIHVYKIDIDSMNIIADLILDKNYGGAITNNGVFAGSQGLFIDPWFGYVWVLHDGNYIHKIDPAGMTQLGRWQMPVQIAGYATTPWIRWTEKGGKKYGIGASQFNLHSTTLWDVSYADKPQFWVFNPENPSESLVLDADYRENATQTCRIYTHCPDDEGNIWFCDRNNRNVNGTYYNAWHKLTWATDGTCSLTTKYDMFPLKASPNYAESNVACAYFDAADSTFLVGGVAGYTYGAVHGWHKIDKSWAVLATSDNYDFGVFGYELMDVPILDDGTFYCWSYPHKASDGTLEFSGATDYWKLVRLKASDLTLVEDLTSTIFPPRSFAPYYLPPSSENKWHPDCVLWVVIPEHDNKSIIGVGGHERDNVGATGGQHYMTYNTFQRYFIGGVQGGPQNLQYVVEDICRRCDLNENEFEAASLHDYIVRGLVIADKTEARNALESLATVYQFDAVESDWKVKFIKRGGGIAVTVPESDLLRSSDDKSLMTESQVLETEVPGRYVIVYMDKDRDYQQGAQAAKRVWAPLATVGSKQQAKLEIPIVLDRTEGKQLAEKIMYEAWAGRKNFQSGLMPKWLKLDCTDVFALNWAGQSYRVRMLRTDEGYGVRFNAQLDDDGVFHSYIAGDAGGTGTTPPQNTSEPFSPTQTYVLDIPYLRDVDGSQSKLSYYSIMSPTDADGKWAGAALYASKDRSSWNSVASQTIPALYGTAAFSFDAGWVTKGVYPLVDDANDYAAPAATWDRVSTLKVWMVKGTLATVSEAAVLTGQNWALFGNEVIGFANVELKTDGYYYLTNLLRGRCGTEHCTDHQNGTSERFVVLNAYERIDTTLNDLNQTLYYRGVSLGSLFTLAPESQIKLSGVSLKPWSPCSIRATKDASNNLFINWLRRTRYNGGWIDGTGEVPLNEGSEKYDVEILANDGTVKRTISNITTTQTYYSSSAQVADFGSNPSSLRVRVYQLSDTVGRGFPGETADVMEGLPPVGGGLDATSVFGVPIHGSPQTAGEILVFNGTELVWRKQWQGEYNASTQYQLNDVVSYQGFIWIALKSAKAVTPGTDDTAWTAMGGHGRGTVSLTTGSLAQNAAQTGTIALGKSFHLLRVQASRKCRIQLYATAALRDADAGRAIGTAPTAGDPHGVICDFALDSEAKLDFICSPSFPGSNVEASPSANIAYRITNLDTVTGTVEVTFTRRVLEQ